MKYYLYTRTFADDFPPIERFSLGFSEKETPELFAEFREWFLPAGKYALTAFANKKKRIFWLRTRDFQRKDHVNRPIACLAAIVAEPDEEEYICSFFATLILEEGLRDQACEALCNDARKVEPPATPDPDWRQPSCSQEWPSEELKHVVLNYQKVPTETRSTGSALKTIIEDNQPNRRAVASQLLRGKRISTALGESLPPKSLRSETSYCFLISAEHIESGEEFRGLVGPIRNSEAGKQVKGIAKILGEQVRNSKWWSQSLLLLLAVVLTFLFVENQKLAEEYQKLEKENQKLSAENQKLAKENQKQGDKVEQSKKPVADSESKTNPPEEKASGQRKEQPDKKEGPQEKQEKPNQSNQVESKSMQPGAGTPATEKAPKLTCFKNCLRENSLYISLGLE